MIDGFAAIITFLQQHFSTRAYPFYDHDVEIRVIRFDGDHAMIYVTDPYYNGRWLFSSPLF